MSQRDLKAWMREEGEGDEGNVCWMEVWSSCRDRIDARRTLHLAGMYLAISAFEIAR
jgi:hypothetical protein